MKSLALGLCAALVLSASSGCCCFWHNVYAAVRCPGIGCGGCGGGCGGCPYESCSCDGGGCGCGCGQAAPCETAPCEAAPCEPCCETACGDGCGGCGQGFGWGFGHGDGCSGCGNDFTLLGWLFGPAGWRRCGGEGCNILGCSSHYLDPQGACYGSYCGGSCCEQAGCGAMYWGDYWNVPPTTDPCSCCQNYVGPYHRGGSTPSYYGPVAPYYGGHGAYPAGHGSYPAGPQVPAEESVIVSQKPGTRKPAPAKTVSRPINEPRM